jgi:archaemetzincin
MKKEKAPKKFGLRFRKVVIHEFGHNWGLPHCPDKTCVMTDAVESVKTIDNAKLALCEKCNKRLG